MLKNSKLKSMLCKAILGAVIAGNMTGMVATQAFAATSSPSTTVGSNLTTVTTKDAQNLAATLTKANNVVNVTAGYSTTGMTLKEDHADIEVFIESLPNISIKLDKNAIKFDNIDLVKENTHEKCVDMTVESNMPYDLFVKGLDDFRATDDKNNKTTIPVGTLSTQVGNSGYKTIELNKDVFLLTESSVGDKHFDVSFKMQRYMKALAGKYKTTLRYTAKQK